MKKLLFITTLLISFSLQSVSAQIKVRAGVNLASQKITSNLFGGVSETTDNKVLFQLGLTYDISISNNLSLRPGLLINGKGGGFENENAITLFYANIPLDLVYNFGSDGNGFSLHTGPTFGLLLSASDSNNSPDLKNELSSTDLGLDFGITYDLDKFGFGINYELGLGNVANIDDSIIDFTLKNNVATLFLTYKL